MKDLVEKVTKKKAGRPPKYEGEKTIKKVTVLMELGATDQQAAEALGINEATFYRWKLAHPDFCKAANILSNAHDDSVEKSLLTRAKGYTRTVQKAFVSKGEPIIVEVVEDVPPDVNAARMWLQNRRRKTWNATEEGEQDDHGIKEININVVTKAD